MELETYKMRVKTLQEDNKGLKQASVIIQAKAEVRLGWGLEEERSAK